MTGRKIQIGQKKRNLFHLSWNLIFLIIQTKKNVDTTNLN